MQKIRTNNTLLSESFKNESALAHRRKGAAEIAPHAESSFIGYANKTHKISKPPQARRNVINSRTCSTSNDSQVDHGRTVPLPPQALHCSPVKRSPAPARGTGFLVPVPSHNQHGTSGAIALFDSYIRA